MVDDRYHMDGSNGSSTEAGVHTVIRSGWTVWASGASMFPVFFGCCSFSASTVIVARR